MTIDPQQMIDDNALVVCENQHCLECSANSDIDGYDRDFENRDEYRQQELDQKDAFEREYWGDVDKEDWRRG